MASQLSDDPPDNCKRHLGLVAAKIFGRDSGVGGHGRTEQGIVRESSRSQVGVVPALHTDGYRALGAGLVGSGPSLLAQTGCFSDKGWERQ